MSEPGESNPNGVMGEGHEIYAGLENQLPSTETPLELSGHKFGREAVDFRAVKDHLSIHQGGEVAGSQFNGEVFPDSEAFVSFLSQALPAELEYDRFGRVELTLEVKLPGGEAVGYSGVKSTDELVAAGVSVEKGVRLPGGEEGEVDGVRGAWYPEVVRSSQTGRFVTALNPDGSVKNPHGKFEPLASIAKVTDAEAARTNKVSVVMTQDKQTGTPVVLTAYPGELAPPYPAKIESEALTVDTLKGREAEYWEKHAFIKFV